MCERVNLKTLTYIHTNRYVPFSVGVCVCGRTEKSLRSAGPEGDNKHLGAARRHGTGADVSLATRGLRADPPLFSFPISWVAEQNVI